MQKQSFGQATAPGLKVASKYFKVETWTSFAF